MKQQNTFRLFRLLSSFCYLLTILLVGCSKSHTIQAPSSPNELLTTSKVNKNLVSMNSFEAQGKLGYSDGRRGGNANLFWQQEGKDYLIRLYGPLGSGSAQILGQKGRVTLTRADGQVLVAKTPEELVAKELGVLVPVSGLRYWLQGIPAPGTPPEQMQYDQQQRVWQIIQQGWRVQYQAYQEVGGMSVPYKLLLRNGAIRLKFIFHHWDITAGR